MRRRLQAALLASAVLVPSILPAQETPADSQKIVFSGQVRLRSELDDRHVLADERVNVHLLRTRIRATARPAPGITVLAELQDARHLGSGDPRQGRGTTDPSADGLDMRQAWAQVSRPLDLPLDARFGRQEISFANERLVGVSNWSNTGRSFDGARATVRAAGDLTVDLWGARLVAPTPGPTTSQNFYGVWGTWRAAPGVTADAFAMYDDDTSPIRRGVDSAAAVLGRYTLGGNLRAARGRFALELEGASQLGRAAPNDSSPRQDVRAFLAHAQASATLASASRTRLSVLTTVLSGDDDPADGRDERFSTLFGTNHLFYGTMDIVPELSGPVGLRDYAASLATVPAAGVRLLVEGHGFLPHRGPDGSLGSEADVTVAWRAAPPFEISGGASVFFPGRLMRSRVGSDPRYWVYVAGVWDF